MRVWWIIFMIASLSSAPSAPSDACPKAGDEIASDRPDIIISSIALPVGSLQSKTGINLTTLWAP
jgi:hypothetical protein